MDTTIVVTVVAALTILLGVAVASMGEAIRARGKASDDLVKQMAKQLMAHSQGELERLKIERDQEYMMLANNAIVRKTGAYVPETTKMPPRTTPNPPGFDMETDGLLGG